MSSWTSLMPTACPAKTWLKLLFLLPKQMRPQRVTTMVLRLIGLQPWDTEALGYPYCPADFPLGALFRNSSPIQRWKASVFWGRPRKFFTRSFADIDPP